MLSPSQVTQLPNNRARRLKNLTCAYCGAVDQPDNPLTDDHVIGRRFVPKGALASGWCLILRACERCNNAKADLEDDISAITLLPPIGEAHQDAELAELSRRKAKGSLSRRTKKPVADSVERMKIKGRLMGSVDVSFGLVAPPQMDPRRVRQLAHAHLQAFFYYITFDEAQRAGGFIPGKIGWLNEAHRPDWGNPAQRGFATLTRDWALRAEGTGADGYFKIAIRRDPSGAEIWSFALEWNKNLRVVGFFGDAGLVQDRRDEIPPLDWQRIDAMHRMRRDTPLDEEDDILFDPTTRPPMDAGPSPT